MRCRLSAARLLKTRVHPKTRLSRVVSNSTGLANEPIVASKPRISWSLFPPLAERVMVLLRMRMPLASWNDRIHLGSVRRNPVATQDTLKKDLRIYSTSLKYFCLRPILPASRLAPPPQTCLSSTNTDNCLAASAQLGMPAYWATASFSKRVVPDINKCKTPLKPTFASYLYNDMYKDRAANLLSRSSFPEKGLQPSGSSC